MNIQCIFKDKFSWHRGKGLVGHTNSSESGPPSTPTWRYGGSWFHFPKMSPTPICLSQGRVSECDINDLPSPCPAWLTQSLNPPLPWAWVAVQKWFTEENHYSSLQLLPGSLGNEFVRRCHAVMQRCVDEYFVGGGFNPHPRSGHSWDQASSPLPSSPQPRHKRKVFRKTQIQPVVCPTAEALSKAALLSPLSPWDHEKEPCNNSCYFKPLKLVLKVLFHLPIVL